MNVQNMNTHLGIQLISPTPLCSQNFHFHSVKLKPRITFPNSSLCFSAYSGSYRFCGDRCKRTVIRRKVSGELNQVEEHKQKQPLVKKQYPFYEIEPKWQRYWEENRTFRTPDEIDTSKPKYYVLDMFPYPRSLSPSLLSFTVNFECIFGAQ